jgi:hypothetical protein
MVVQCVKNKAQVKEKNKGKQPVPKKALPPIPTSGNFDMYCFVVSFTLPEHLSSPPGSCYSIFSFMCSVL